MPPKVLARNTERSGGLLPVNPFAAARAAPKPPPPRRKLEVRRLPPGLTLPEFEATLGEEWNPGNGKVHWREYRPGKTRPAGSSKAAEQSRCYLHVGSDASAREFEKRFLDVVFHDRAGTHRLPDLQHLPPTLGFAPNQRTPLQLPKPRADNRQGTIDQDPEFIAFLEAETQPIARPSAVDAPGTEKEADKTPVKSTPLLDDLREKKANKAKAAAAKVEKAEREKKERRTAATTTTKKEGHTGMDKNTGKALPQHIEQVAKDAAKVLNKQAAVRQQAQQQTQQVKPAAAGAKGRKPAGVQSPKPPHASPAPTPPPTAAASPASQRAPPRRRGNVEGIKAMLQKDLALKPKPPATSQAAGRAPARTAPQPGSAATPSVPTSTPTPNPARPPPSQPSSRPSSSSSAAVSASSPRPAPVKAYLKHANPSQGMTEILIQQALGAHGGVTNVVIDPRKGTAIAFFQTAEGLQRALQARRVPVANGAVEVHEFRERQPGGPAGRGGTMRGRGGRGGGGRGAAVVSGRSSGAGGAAAKTAGTA